MQDARPAADTGSAGQAREGPSRDELRQLVAHAVLAPSGGNAQAWRFAERPDGRLRCFYDARRAENFLDFEHSASYLALGAAVENMAISAAARGFDTDVELITAAGSEQVADVRFTRSNAPRAQVELVDEIERRCTNRRLGRPGELISRLSLDRLTQAAAQHDAELQLASAPDALAEIARVVGVCDRIRLCSELMHRELMAEVRWSQGEAERTGDGVDVRTLEINAAQRWLLKRLSRYRNVRALSRLGAEPAFEQIGAEAVKRSGTIGLLTVSGTSPESYFQGGRALESVWLNASGLGLGFQPLAVAPYMFARLLRGSGFSAEQERQLSAERTRLGGVFRLADQRAEVMMFRLSVVPPPSTRALRRRVADVLGED